MIEKQVVCSNCYEGITSHICEQCLFRHMIYWVRDLPTNKESKKIILNRLRRLTFADLILFETGPCNICSRDGPVICEYCFFQKATSILSSLNLPAQHMESFMEIFNYSTHENYIKNKLEEE